MNISPHTRIVSVAEMQRLEQEADAAGQSYAAMMEQAGIAVADAIQKRFLPTTDAPVLVLVGPGNNGGDGLVCARHLNDAGYPVRVYLWKRKTAPQDNYEGHFAQLVKRNVPTHTVQEDPDSLQLAAWLDEAVVVVDALLGTGANRPIKGDLARICRQLTQARHRLQDKLAVVCVDVPSGLHADSGMLDPHTVPADLTVTFGCAKTGHFQFPGAAILGDLVVADISIPPELTADILTFFLTPEYVAGLLPERSNNSHKGTFGKGMAIVGCVNFPGAVVLSCAAMGRVGAGLVTGAVPQPVWMSVASALAEPTWLLLSHTLGIINADAVGTINQGLHEYDALLIGCGLGQANASRTFLQQFLSRKHRHPPLPPTVLDADGLNNLAQLDDWPSLLPAACVLTPHPAEMARLCGMPSAVINNRWSLAQEKAATWDAVILLKGPYTVIAHPDGRLAVLPVATPALATAGSGDILAGAITGLLAQGLSPFHAACLGAWLHGRAGELCEQEIGPAGVVARDLLPFLPAAMNELRG